MKPQISSDGVELVRGMEVCDTRSFSSHMNTSIYIAPYGCAETYYKCLVACYSMTDGSCSYGRQLWDTESSNLIAKPENILAHKLEGARRNVKSCEERLDQARADLEALVMEIK